MLPTSASVAGLLDRDGCVSAMPFEGRIIPVVNVGMTEDPEPLLLLRARFGGTVEQIRLESPKWPAAWRWLIAGPPAAAMLTEILPELRQTRQRAELAVQLESASAEDARTLSARIAELNVSAPEPSPPERGWIAQRVGVEWQSPQMGLFGPEGSVSFSGTWPRAGSMRGGAVYEHPASEHLTAGTDGSVLRTPTASLATNGGSQHPAKRKAGGHGPTLADEVEHLLPES